MVECLVVLSEGDLIHSADLPDYLRLEPDRKNILGLRLPPEGISLEKVERKQILMALRKFDLNQSRAAQYLDLSRKTLIYRMEKFDLRREQDPEEQ